MKADAHPLLAIATSIADGQDVDWQQVEAGLRSDDERALLRSLRLIASIGELHRSTDVEEEERLPAGLFTRRGRVVGRIGTAPPADGPMASSPAAPPASPASFATAESLAETGVVASPPPPPASLRSSRPSASAESSSLPPSALPVGALPPSSGAGPDSDLPAPERWGSLVVRERVGAGVFGEVYRAYDEQLQREVALKLLRTGARSADRLVAKVLHEGRLLARMRHPNVVLVHGVEARGDRVGLWMEFVRGCTLEQLLTRQGLFGAREAALIGQDLCRALAAVHAAGLVHRDVKAQNVMREEGGRVVLMDFGTGVPVRDEPGSSAAPAAGTPLYLAPELLDGEEATPSSDLYSLGVLLYHLVTGTYPITAASLIELREAHRRGRRRLQDARPDLPDAFVQAVDRALAPSPADRHPSAGAMQDALTRALGIDTPMTASAEALRIPPGTSGTAVPSAPDAPSIVFKGRTRRWLMISGLFVIAAAVAVWLTQPLWRTPAPGPINSVVVLPLANLSSGDRDLADGINLLIAERLSMVPGIRVVHYTPLMASRDKGASQAEIMRRQQVDGAIDGSVSWSGSRAQVFVRLIPAGMSSPRWVKQFDVPTRRAAELPRDVAREVARAMSVDGSSAEASPGADLESAEPAAFEAYLRGRVKLREGTVAGLDLAVTHLLDAVRRDPEHAPSHAALANCYLMQSITLRVRTITEGATLAKASAERALALDYQLPEAHQAIADIRFYIDWNWAGAEEAFKRAIELNPNAGDVRQRYAMFLASRKRLPDAMQELHRAVALDPMSPVANAALGMLWHYSRSDDQAERIYRSVLDQDPLSREARVGLIRTLIATRRFTLALDELTRVRTQDGQRQAPVYLGAAGMAYAALGRQPEARAIADELTREDSDGASFDAASVYAALGNQAEAFEILEQAVNLRLPKVLFLRLDPRFDPLRGHPRFTALLERIGLPS